jgi:hypothetical protein
MLISCENSGDNILDTDAELAGVWVDTVDALPKGYYVNELSFETNQFTEKTTSFGTYPGQDNNTISGWFIRTGSYNLKSNKIVFVVNETVSWDSFFGGDPITTMETGVIFENCVFNIENDILELNYITYPADAPEHTIRRYLKVE